jgi:hypothetical protein
VRAGLSPELGRVGLEEGAGGVAKVAAATGQRQLVAPTTDSSRVRLERHDLVVSEPLNDQTHDALG